MPDIYGTATGFRSYHNDRGGTLPVTAADDDTVAEWLLVASEWIDARFRTLFPGLKVGQRAQIREWPRQAAFDIYGYAVASDNVPVEVLNATYEVALREANNPGGLTVDYTAPKYKSVRIDGALSVEYASFASASDTQVQIGIVGQILGPILTGYNAGGNMLSGTSCRG